jgi:hypothetical protein
MEYEKESFFKQYEKMKELGIKFGCSKWKSILSVEIVLW